LTVSDTVQFMAEATSLHFDALQSWSGQMLVPAPHWQLALAHAGLLPDRNLLCYPKDSLYTRITLQRLVPAPCAGFRLATFSDLPQLLELEAQWDSAFLRSSEAILRQRLELEPSGQFVAFGGDGALLAAMYTQRVASLEVLQHGPSIPSRSRPRGYPPFEMKSTTCAQSRAPLWARKESPHTDARERLQRRSIACPHAPISTDLGHPGVAQGGAAVRGDTTDASRGCDSAAGRGGAPERGKPGRRAALFCAASGAAGGGAERVRRDALP